MNLARSFPHGPNSIKCTILSEYYDSFMSTFACCINIITCHYESLNFIITVKYLFRRRYWTDKEVTSRLVDVFLLLVLTEHRDTRMITNFVYIIFIVHLILLSSMGWLIRTSVDSKFHYKKGSIQKTGMFSSTYNNFYKHFVVKVFNFKLNEGCVLFAWSVFNENWLNV